MKDKYTRLRNFNLTPLGDIIDSVSKCNIMIKRPSLMINN